MSVPSLQQMQRWLKWAITHPKNARAAIEGHEFEPRPSGECFIAETPDLNRFDRLDIYGKAFFLRLTEYLEGVYPRTRSLFRRAGLADLFDEATVEYVVSRPSRGPNIDTFGLDFGLFLSEKPIKNAADYQWLREFVQLESAALQAVLTTSHASRITERLRPDTDLDAAVLVLDPTLQFLESAYDLWEAWKACDTACLPPCPAETSFVIWRDLTGAPRIKKMEADAVFCLKQLGEAVPLGALNTRGNPGAVAGWFKEWVENGMIRDIEAPNHAPTEPHSVSRQRSRLGQTRDCDPADSSQGQA